MEPGDQSKQSAGREPGALRAAATWGLQAFCSPGHAGGGRELEAHKPGCADRVAWSAGKLRFLGNGENYCLEVAPATKEIYALPLGSGK